MTFEGSSQNQAFCNLQGGQGLDSRKLGVQFLQPLRGKITEFHTVQDAGQCPKVPYTRGVMVLNTG